MRAFSSIEASTWDAVPLDAPAYRLAGSAPPQPVQSVRRCAPPAGALLIRATDAAGTEHAGTEPGWCVLAAAGAHVRLNGAPLALGIAQLAHRDELRLPGGARVFFSTEREATVTPYPADDAPGCPRCAQPIARGAPSVRCPGCGVCHHQLADRPCWTHIERCALCAQPTALGGGPRWTPEGL